MSGSLKVHLIPVLKDNYAYIIQEEGSPRCIVVDPGESAPVINFLKGHDLTLHQIWLTHFHSDHIGGVEELIEKNRCSVIGPEEEKEKIPFLTEGVSDLDFIHFGSHKAKVMQMPGHTLGHLAFWFFDDHILFSGDTLFSLGCGYLFEGTPHQMWTSLRRLRDLPGDTKVYCGHEYTEDNARFALSIDPKNQDLISYSEEVKEKRMQGKPTIPTTIAQEIRTNPFLRADLPYWKKLLNLPDASPDDIFAFIREKKNKFKS